MRLAAVGFAAAGGALAGVVLERLRVRRRPCMCVYCITNGITITPDTEQTGFEHDYANCPHQVSVGGTVATHNDCRY